MVNVTASYSPKHFLLKALSNLLDFILLTAGSCAGPGIYPQIYLRAPCSAVLVCKGVR